MLNKIKNKFFIILILMIVCVMLFSCGSNSGSKKVMFIEDESGHKMYKNQDGIYVKNDWYEISGDKYFFNSNGYLVTNKWVNDEYYVDENGKMKTDYWLEENGKMYYLDSDGKYKRDGKYTINGKDYIFGSSGELVKDCITNYDDKTFIVDKKGMVVKDECPIEVDGLEYYISKDGELLKNEWKTINNVEKYYGGDYYRVLDGFAIAKGFNISTQSDVKINWNYINKDGKIIKDEWVEDKTNSKWCYADENGILLSNVWKTDNGADYYFDDDCYMVTNDFVDGIYYVDENGKKLKDIEKNINGTNYIFDSNGKSNIKVVPKTRNVNWIVKYAASLKSNIVTNKNYYQVDYKQYLSSGFLDPKSNTLSQIMPRRALFCCLDKDFYYIIVEMKFGDDYYPIKKYDDNTTITISTDGGIYNYDKIFIADDGEVLLSNSQCELMRNLLMKDGNKISIMMHIPSNDGSAKTYEFSLDSTGFKEVFLSL